MSRLWTVASIHFCHGVSFSRFESSIMVRMFRMMPFTKDMSKSFPPRRPNPNARWNYSTMIILLSIVIANLPVFIAQKRLSTYIILRSPDD